MLVFGNYSWYAYDCVKAWALYRKEKEVDWMYRYETDVKYSEMTKNLVVAPHQILNYFQDCSTMDSEMIGKGIEYLEVHKRGWLLSSWQIEILDYPRFKQHISVGTWPYDFSGIYGYRNFDICDDQGRRLVQANSIWCLVDMKSGIPVKITDEDVEGYELLEAIDMPPVTRKLPLYKDGGKPEAFAVRRNDIDTNDHVNNAKYIAFAEEYLPEDFWPGRIRVQYRQAAKYGDILYPLVTELEDGYAVSLCDEAYKPYVSMEFES